MKYLNFLIITLSIFLISTQLFAWSKVGNGGFVIDCDGKIEIFDFYEAQSKNLSFKPIPGNTVEEKVDFLLTKLETLDPNRAKNYRFQYKTYWEENTVEKKLKPIFTLDHIDVRNKQSQKDYGIGDVTIPKGCLLKLALQQIAPEYNNGDRIGRIKIEIYNRLWDKLSNNLKANLILHELFYREDILLRFNFNSVGIRRLNAWLSSEEFNSTTQKGWEELLEASNFKPMFPNFEHKDNLSQIDLETDSGKWNGFKTYKYEAPIMQGKITFSPSQDLIVNSHSPFYFRGYYPEYFSLKNSDYIDLSHLSDRHLLLSVEPTCLFRLANVKSKDGASLKLISIGYDKDNNIIPNCGAYIEPGYVHDRIVKMQSMNTYLIFDKFSKVPRQMLLTRSDSFSELIILVNGIEKEISSLKINLENGELFDIKIKNFVELSN